LPPKMPRDLKDYIITQKSINPLLVSEVMQWLSIWTKTLLLHRDILTSYDMEYTFSACSFYTNWRSLNACSSSTFSDKHMFLRIQAINRCRTEPIWESTEHWTKSRNIATSSEN
jgi:hypothetical protein